MSKALIFFFLFFLSSCSFVKNVFPTSSSDKFSKLASYKKTYQFIDKTGTYSMERISGIDAKTNRYFTKYAVKSSDGQVLERSVVVSKLGKLKGDLPVFQPFASQFQVWFDKEKYESETRFDSKEKQVKVYLKSPEEKWSGVKEANLSNRSGLYCFLSQVIECAQFTGFLQKAVEMKNGKMSLNLIWEGFPYVQEQYLNLPEELLSDATLEYDGMNKEGEYRFTLSIIGNNVFYLLDKNFVPVKVLWPGQGISILGRI